MQLDNEGFKDWLVLKNLKEKTVSDYLYYLKKFEIYNTFSQDTVEAFLKTFDSSVSRSFLKNYLAYMLKHKERFSLTPEQIEKLREIELPKRTGRNKVRVATILSKRDMEKIEAAMTCERDKLMLNVGLYGALRINELVSIRPFDFQWKKWREHPEDSLELKVIGKNDKERIVYIPVGVARRLQAWIRNYASIKNPDPQRPLWMVKKRRFRELLANASKKSLNFSVHPHLLRSTMATWLLRNGLDLIEVKEYLDHSSIATTQIYLQADKERLKENVGRVVTSIIQFG